jgi:lysyl endopeptidase
MNHSSSRPEASASTGLRRWTVLLTCIAVTVLAHSQARARVGAAPVSFSAQLAALPSVDVVVLPPVDEAAYLREDAAREASGIDAPQRFAAPIATQLTPASDGTWEDVAGFGRVWRLRVVSTGARTLNFGLKDLALPQGTSLYFYPARSQEYDGPYSGGDATPQGEFWTAVIPGDEAVIEMDVATGAGFEPRLTIVQVGHDYRGFGQILRENLRQGSCNNDVICPEGDPWRNEIRSEGVYTLGGSWDCSGQMINSLNPAPPPPYFLTAYHCGINSSNASSVVVYWNFESPHCGDLCCGSLNDHQSGSTLKARYSTSDFCLIQFLAAPSPTSNVYMAGWDVTTTDAPASAVCIHHPNCDEKAISFTYTPLAVTSYLGTSSPGDGTHWRVNHWDDGTTEPGSSGSGLWDPNHHVVGELHGGYASCSSITSDWFGRLAVSWNGGGQTSNRLKDWLDPDDTGTMVLDGRNPNDESSVGIAPLRSGTILHSVQPNPARGDFEVRFALERAGTASAEIFDAAGRLVVASTPQSFGPGEGRITMARLPGSNSGARAPGIYFVRLLVDGRGVGSQKVVVLE